jgi:hypothetical protein
MKKTIANLWVEALRSGKYKQTQEVLHRIDSKNESFCCLGVLCNLYQQDRRSKKKKCLAVCKKQIEKEYEISYDGFSALLPRPVIKWAGMKTENGSWDGTNEKTSLIYLNDEDRKTFKSIANVIEKNVENL